MTRHLPAALLLLLIALPAIAGERPPNIVWIVSDDSGYHDFSMHGSDTPTPRIDSIGRSGVRFTSGYVSGCVCSPTRAGLLTGRYQQRFGHEFNIPPVYSETNGLPLSQTVIAELLKAKGYRTIALGKWHLGYAPKFHPMERGFTDYYGFLQGARSYWPLDKPTRLNRLLRDRAVVSPERFDYMTDHLADETTKYIERYHEQSFFIYLAFNATHGPFHATEADLERANGDKVTAMTIALDRAVGKVLDALDKHGLADNTLVCFINDNGGTPRHDNRPLRGNKGSCWEGGIRVPFVMQWPAVIKAGQVRDEPAIALDLFPTTMAAAGIDETTGEALDGIDLLPYLTGGTDTIPPRTLYWKNAEKWAVRDGGLKLVVGDGKPGEQPGLYDVANDISEKHDLAAKRPDDVARLKALYDAWAATHQDTAWRHAKKNKKNQQKQ